MKQSHLARVPIIPGPSKMEENAVKRGKIYEDE